MSETLTRVLVRPCDAAEILSKQAQKWIILSKTETTWIILSEKTQKWIILSKNGSFWIKHKRSTSIGHASLSFFMLLCYAGASFITLFVPAHRTGTKINKLTIDKIDARSKSRNQVYLGYALQGGKRRSQLTFFTH